MKLRWEALLGIAIGVLATYGIKGCVDHQAPAPAAEKQLVLQLDPGNSLDKLPGFDTLEDAAVYAAHRLADCSRYYECGGIIAVRPVDHKFVVGPLVSNRQGDSVEISDSAPLGWTRAADFHSHPCLDATHYPDFFSPDDLRNATTLKVTSFVLDMCTGDVHEFNPDKDSPNDTQIGDSEMWATHGRIVGHIPETHGTVEPNTGFQVL